MSKNTHYFYDLEFRAFYPDENYDEHGPTAVLNFQTEIVEQRDTLLGGRDGFIRCYDRAADDDDSLPINSYVVLPPARLGVNDLFGGMLVELVAALTQDSGSIDWEVLVASTHEALRRATPFASGTWSGHGRTHTERPRARGAVVAVKLSNGENRAWAIEGVFGVIKRTGRIRV